jgi:hypothetical protein
LKIAGSSSSLQRHHWRMAGWVAPARFCAASRFFVLGALLRVLVGPVSLGPFTARFRLRSPTRCPAFPCVTTRRPGMVARGGPGQSGDSGRARVRRQAAHHRPGAEGRDRAGGRRRSSAARSRSGASRLSACSSISCAPPMAACGSASRTIATEATCSIASATRSKRRRRRVFAAKLRRRACALAFYDETTRLFVVAPDAGLEGLHATADVADIAATRSLPLNAQVEVSGQPAHIVTADQAAAQYGPVTGDLSITKSQPRRSGRQTRALAFLAPFLAVGRYLGLIHARSRTRISRWPISASPPTGQSPGTVRENRCM